MLYKRSVLILGAGASAPYGLPVGYRLLDLIKRRCESIATGAMTNDGRDPILEGVEMSGSLSSLTLRYPAGDVHQSDFRALADAIAMARPPSIDSFLEKRSQTPAFRAIAEELITDILLSSESRINPKNPCQDEPWNNDWIALLLSRLTDKATIESVHENPLTIITFNYDRSLEFLLAKGLQATYGTTPEQAQEAVDKMKIIHVYGQIGPFNTRQFEQAREAYSTNNAANWSHISSNFRRSNSGSIRLIHEAREDLSHLENGLDALVAAEALMLLGFGFNEENLDVLNIEKTLDEAAEIYASNHGLRKMYSHQFEERMRNNHHGVTWIAGKARQALEDCSFLS